MKETDTSEWLNFDASAFAARFGTTEKDLPKRVLESWQRQDFRYRPANLKEVEVYALDYLERLQAPWMVRPRNENREAWTKGWQESLDEIRRLGPGPLTCRPKYFRGSHFLRLNKGIVVTPNPQLEHELLSATLEHLFLQYLTQSTHICELGCGSGQNLWRLSELFPRAQILGLDWVEPCVGIADEIARVGRQTSGKVFDLIQPNPNITLAPGSAVISVHALEQIGTDHTDILRWLIAQRPSIVVQHEPIVEFYDPKNVYDFLALLYSQKRHYLQGYYEALIVLAKQDEIEIISAYRPEIGGVYHEASVLVWRPKR